MKWLADENLNNAIVRGLLRKRPGFDIIRAQDVHEVSGRDDGELLRFAFEESRVVVTHDVSTMISALNEQMRLKSACAWIVLAPDSMPVGAVVEDILLLDTYAVEADWDASVIFLPLR